MGRGRCRWLRHAVPAALAAGVLTGASPTYAAVPAQEDDAVGTVVTVEPMLSAEYRAGDHVLLRVTVAADRLIDGRIVVTPRTGDLEVVQDLEVAGGASKELLLLLPTSEVDIDVSQVSVELVDGGEDVASATARLRRDTDIDVAGVLPALLAQAPELPARTTLPGSQRRVNLVVLSPSVLDVGPAALEQLDSIVAASSDLAGLSPAARSTLFGWIDGGGQLVLDDGADLSSLPAPWRPDDAGYALAGAGEVRIVDGVARAGRWAELLEPAPAANEQGFMGNDVFVPPQVTLGQRAGVTLPDLNVLIIVLAAYVVVLGPIAYLVLRRLRRLTLAWIAIPVLAVLTAAAVFVVGSAWRSSGRSTANVAVELHPGGATASADVLLFNRGGGTARLGLPAGWTLDEQASNFFFEAPSSVQRTVQVEDRATTIEATLEAGQLVVLNVSGPASEGDLEVVATADGDTSVAGTVRNTGTRTVRSAAMLARGAAALVGDLAPGEQRTFTLQGVGTDAMSSVVDRVWSDPEIGIGFDSATPGVDFGLWSSFSILKQDRLYPSATVRVAGWVEDRPADVDAGGQLDARTLVTTIAPIGVDAVEPVPAMAVRSSTVQYPLDPRTGAVGEGMYRFVVPPAAAGQPLEVELPPGLRTPSVLLPDGEWSELAQRSGGGEGSDAFAVPPEAVRRGTVLLKADSSEEFGFGMNAFTVGPVLQGAGGG